ncbi:MAG: hypothetical protein ABSA93_29050 [Streptosporangiaceae bacterium]
MRVTGNLPSELTSFVGRRSELAEVKRLLQGAAKRPASSSRDAAAERSWWVLHYLAKPGSSRGDGRGGVKVARAAGGGVPLPCAVLCGGIFSRVGAPWLPGISGHCGRGMCAKPGEVSWPSAGSGRLPRPAEVEDFPVSVMQHPPATGHQSGDHTSNT